MSLDTSKYIYNSNQINNSNQSSNSNQSNAVLSRAKKRQSPPVQNFKHSPAHLETSSSCRSGRPGGPKIGRDTPSININQFQAIPDRFRHF